MPTGKKNPLYLGFADRLRGRIDTSGLYRKDLAVLSGLSQTAPGQSEDGVRVPRLSTVSRLGTALGISPGWLAYGDEGLLPFRHRRRRSPVPHDPPVPIPAQRPANDDWRGVSTRLAGVRKARRLTLRVVGESAGISAQAVLVIERGKGDPMISTIERLAVALDVPPSWLAFGEGEAPEFAVSAPSSSTPHLD